MSTTDLQVIKTGPEVATPGDITTYSLVYLNRTTRYNPATGVQLSDILPPDVTVDANSHPAGALLVGNTIYWDLPNLPVGTGGRILFQVQVKPTTLYN